MRGSLVATTYDRDIMTPIGQMAGQPVDDLLNPTGMSVAQVNECNPHSPPS